MFRKIKENFGTLNLIILIIIILLWISVFFIQGVVGATSWALLKLIIPIIGFLMFIIFIFLTILANIKHKNKCKKIISITLSIILMFPMLLTINVVKLAYPTYKENAEFSLTIPSPFKEDSIIAWGGNTVDENEPHVIWASERFAYDIVMNPFNIVNSNELSNYGIWNKDIYSPVDGIVISTNNSDKDISPNATEFSSLEGNYVYIKIKSTGTYLLMNHLKKESITVKIGQPLKVGDKIGKVGNSGTSSEPHLHIHHQKQNPTTTLHPICSEGLPLYFNINNESILLTKDSILKGFNKN